MRIFIALQNNRDEGCVHLGFVIIDNRVNMFVVGCFILSVRQILGCTELCIDQLTKWDRDLGMLT